MKLEEMTEILIDNGHWVGIVSYNTDLDFDKYPYGGNERTQKAFLAVKNVIDYLDSISGDFYGIKQTQSFIKTRMFVNLKDPYDRDYVMQEKRKYEEKIAELNRLLKEERIDKDEFYSRKIFILSSPMYTIKNYICDLSSCIQNIIEQQGGEG